MTHSGAPVVPLGAFAEIILPHVHGLALKARSGLSASEIELISPLVRDRISEPFTFLREEFKIAWDEAAQGGALKFLANRHAAALSILRPVEVGEKSWWQRLISARQDAIELKLSDALDREFAALVKSAGDSVAPKRKFLIDVDELIAA
jgi:hypothetical protein